MKSSIVRYVLLAVALLAVGAFCLVHSARAAHSAPAPAQATAPVSELTADHATMVGLMRSINTAEYSYRNQHGHFTTWDELCDSNLLKPKGTPVDGGPPEARAWKPNIMVDVVVTPEGDSYSVAIHDALDTGHLFSVFSGTSGLIYTGEVIH